MRAMCSRLGLLVAVLFWLANPLTTTAQTWGYVEGLVTDAETGTPLPNVTVLVDGTNFGTATNNAGRYHLDLPPGTYVLRYSLIGYRPHYDSLVVDRTTATTINVHLHTAPVEMDEVVVEDERRHAEPGVYAVDPRQIPNMPAPMQDGFRMLKTLPGVAANNELSSEYSVRGGGYNENLVFINGFEVYKSHRLRKGEQEGLGIINPDLVETLTFYTGGFPARYGGKLSSALDVRYRRPDNEPLHGSASLSLLDAAVSTGASALDGRVGWTVGARRAQPFRFYETQQLEGVYKPLFEDLQGTLAVRLTSTHAVEAFGIWQRNRFDLTPQNRTTEFGTQENAQVASFRYQGHEHDAFQTRLGSLRLTSRLATNLRAEHDVAYYETDEREDFDVNSTGAVFDVVLDLQTGATVDTTDASFFVHQERMFNRVRVQTWTGQGRWMAHTNRHAAEAGWYARYLRFADHLLEASRLETATDSTTLFFIDDLADYPFPEPDSIVERSYQGHAALRTAQAGGYVQDTFDLLPERDRLLVTAGLRFDYFDFNGAWTVSPRLSARYRYSELLTVMGSWGVYHQPPSYRELRGAPEPGQPLHVALNRDLKAQRSIQVVAGAEYFRPHNRFYFRGEAYYKHLTHLVTYNADGILMAYSGENDARGYTYGLDLRVQGEFVPGFDSWVNYSFMVSRERMLPAFETSENTGWIPRPMDQRHTFSLYVQDYLPGDQTWKLHLRTLFGSGFPYTPPRVGEGMGQTTLQVPARRNTARFPRYFRFDLGASKILTLSTASFSKDRPVRLQLTAEVLNMFDMLNTVRYLWVPEGNGQWARIPTRLTPRTFNLRARLDF